jgi:hypothetical protein
MMVTYANYPSETLYPAEDLVPGVYIVPTSPEETVKDILVANWIDAEITKVTEFELVEDMPLSIDHRRANYVRISRLSGPVTASAVKASDDVYTIQCEYSTVMGRDEFNAMGYEIGRIIDNNHVYPTSQFQSIRVIRKHSDTHDHKRLWRGTIDVEVVNKWREYDAGDVA